MSRIKKFFKDSLIACKEISMETGDSKFYIMISIINDFIRYGASPNNYKKFGFYNLTSEQKATYVTNRISSRLIKKYNVPEYIDIFEDKVKFARTFSEYFNRKWIFVNECSKCEWKKFAGGGIKKAVCKPIGASQGKGICVINPQEYSFEDIKKKFDNNIIEEFICQHHEINEFYDKAVNCLRVITVLKDEKVNILAANLTFGLEYEIANASYGGITTEVEINTGKLASKGGQFGHHVFETHPYSNKKFEGFIIPFWKEILKMLSICGKKIPQIGYVGWDIAVKEDGPILIEGNTTPGYTYFQIPELLDNGYGVMGQYKSFL